MTLMLRKPTILGSHRAKGKPRKETKNVVIFGETGVGKSSLINLIAGRNISETSSSAVGCTLNYQRYPLNLDNQHFAIWDTAGLDEGTEETVPAEKAEAYIKRLLRDLVRANSIDLLVYCVRGTRVRSALLANYHLFYSAICRKKVPIAIVITGLENQEDDMDIWWLKNERQFSALQMRFDNYACVTTLQSSMGNATLEERRRISKAALIKMITSTRRTEQWKPAKRSWADTATADIHAILSSNHRNMVHVANVIVCDVSQPPPVSQDTIKRSATFQIPVSLSLFLTRLIKPRSTMSVVNESENELPFNVSMKCTPERLFRVHQVSRKQTPPTGKEEHTKKNTVVKRGADLLVFCVEMKCIDVKSQWDHFNVTYGGDLSPQIVIVVGATDPTSAVEWWNCTALGGAITRPQAGDPSVTFWPANESFAEAEAARARLRALINTYCIDCSKASFAADKQLFTFRRGTSLHLDKSLISLRATSVARNSRVDVPAADWQDILTRWGVWEHISTERVTVTEPSTIPLTVTTGDDWVPFPSMSS